MTVVIVAVQPTAIEMGSVEPRLDERQLPLRRCLSWQSSLIRAQAKIWPVYRLIDVGTGYGAELGLVDNLVVAT